MIVLIAILLFIITITAVVLIDISSGQWKMSNNMFDEEELKEQEEYLKQYLKDRGTIK